MNHSPRARKDQLIVKELDGEVLVYDLKRDKAHCLNSTAGLVWKCCDGKSSVSEIAKSLGDETQTIVDDRIVLLALDQLEKFRLLEDVPIKPAYLEGVSRRELVRRVGFAALALPVIVSISAPTAQAQGSLLPPGACCTNPNQCASNGCSQNPICTGSPSTKACD
jgi:hypothetical protein